MQKSAFLLLLLSISLLGWIGEVHAQPFMNRKNTEVNVAKPNILIIMADDLDSRQLSCYGGQNIQTQNIDQLAREGLKFNQIIASEAMCVPTRASLFTGLYPARHGAYQNHKAVYNNLKSVVHDLNDLGYRVALSGKDHVTKPEAVFPFRILPGLEPNCVASTDHYFLDSIAAFINNRESPYCLFLMSINPHAPWTVGNPSEFDPEKLRLPSHWVDTDTTRKQFAKYLAEVRRLDDQVGDIMQMLVRSGQADNTIVIFLGEQGPQFPGGKWTLWDNGQKSSMIVRWPGKAKPQAETNALVQYEDIAPTLISIAGGKAREDMDGRSFVSVIEGKKKQHRAYAYGIHNNFPEGPAYPIRSIRNGDFKLILNLQADSAYYIKYMMNPKDNRSVYASWLEKAQSDTLAKKLANRIALRPAVEFYDLKNDPEELNNLADESAYKDRIGNMSKELRAWMRRQGDRGIAMDVPFDRK